MNLVGVDTSVSVPLLVATHDAHAVVGTWALGKRLALCGHAAAETYSVLTRLPGDLGVLPDQAMELIDDNFEPWLRLPDSVDVPRALADVRITGGAVYDGLVALVAAAHGVPLATRDRRARGTYEALGVTVDLVVVQVD